MISTENIKVKNILVIGDIMLDHYIYGNCNRISPEAPVQVVEVKRELYTLGGAGNVLQNIKSLGSEASIISVVGNDDNAQIVFDQLQESGIHQYSIVKDHNRCTTVKSRVLVSKHQLIRLDKEDTKVIDSDVTEKLVAELKKQIPNYNMVMISDYNKGMLSEKLLAETFKLTRQLGIKTIVDPKGSDFSKYKGANIIKPNKKEAAVASGISIKDRDSLETACIKIKEITHCDNVVVTMSEDGIASYANGKLTIIPTQALDIIDVTGAGDTVLASLGVAFASGYSLNDACDFANHAAAVVVSKVGSATATLDEIKKRYTIQ